MEGNNLPPGNMMQWAPYGSLDSHSNSVENHTPNSRNQIFNNSQMPGNFTMSATEPDDFPGFPFIELEKSDKHHHHHRHSHHSIINCMSDDEEHDMIENATDTPSGKSKKGSVWHRMKWTDSMVKLLITAVSYTGDDQSADLGGVRRHFTVMQKKGKWRAISKVMGERSCNVSPQQCEDKFNDLNKRYKRLTDILGRGAACNVLANPALLDTMNNLSDKMKDDVKKILNSKHLFYQEMCSYHNNNRNHLPEDHALQNSLLRALRCKEEHDPRRDASVDADEDDQSADSDYEKNDEEQNPVHTSMSERSMQKRACHGDVALINSSSHKGSETSGPHGITADTNKISPDGTNLALLQKDLASQALEIQRRRLLIEENDLELRKKRFSWEQYRKKNDRAIERMILKNEYMMLENKRLELEIRNKELEFDTVDISKAFQDETNLALLQLTGLGFTSTRDSETSLAD
ncbi:hypothetical protein BAE44_0022893 [Dichanthelium oligosanthes]|uniref:Myb/SANT-like DNA-binding domain-containing protein n=1 Tax=Dichanthelium oligosanthes TaxID=888268 RepID=A0A1E5UTE3_9POAL|nr:hypothetical protein BAE44_0022893 [Dichanthelium oligosanthes]